MHAIPVHSVALMRSSNTSIDDTMAITGIANMLSDAVPAGSTPSTAVQSRNPKPVAMTPA